MGLFDDKVAIITGGSSGIGRATALAFAHEGANVVIGDVNREGGNETVKLIRESGGDALFLSTDVTQSSQVQSLVMLAAKTYGRLDYAFNNAGIGEPHSRRAAELTEENWDRVNGVNLKGVWLCMKYEIPLMIERGGCAIVNTSSIASVVVSATGPAYVSSKHGLIGLSKSTALAYRSQGIRVNVVCPGFIRTPLLLDSTSLRPLVDRLDQQGLVGEPHNIADAVVWL